MNRSKLEDLSREYVARSIEITKRAVKASGFDYKDIAEVVLVGGQTRMPLIQDEVRKLFGKEPNRSINPDEVVAAGAALQAGIMQGDVKDVLLLDVTPLGLGIETLGGVATRVIEKNTTVPTSRSQTFSTAADNQTSVEIHVVQGEREMAADNKTLARFTLEGIPPAARGMPQVEVTFDIDVNGILSVKAKDKTSGKEQSVRIEGSGGLSKEEVARMKQDAEVHAEEDKKKKEAVETRNMADALITTAERAIKDAGDKITSELKTEIESCIIDLHRIKDVGSIEEVRKASDALAVSMQKIGPSMNSTTPPPSQPST